jgi:hypothetical protein
MTITTDGILDVLGAHGIRPLEASVGGDESEVPDAELPGIGEIQDGETVYTTSIAEVFRTEEPGLADPETLDIGDPRIRGWSEEIERIMDNPTRNRVPRPRGEAPEPHCAWYCPIHYFGHGWGIYIREACILSHAIDIASFIHWPSVKAARREIPKQLLRSAFYVFFLHEQFHHKIESLGLRLLVATHHDCYRPYKKNVYRPTYLTPDCLEESLANAESYRRLGEARYVDRLDGAIRSGLRDYLKASISMQPPGYAEGLNYLSEAPYRRGLYSIQSQILDGVIPPITPSGYWSVAPNMITALIDISDEIYVILPRGGRPIFRPTSVDPGTTVSSHQLQRALMKHYGYRLVPGGKGSHVKLAKERAPTIILPGNRAVVSPGVVKQALNAIGGHPISKLPDFLEGKLPVDA